MKSEKKYSFWDNVLLGLVYVVVSLVILGAIWGSWHDFRICMGQGYTVFKCLEK